MQQSEIIAIDVPRVAIVGAGRVGAVLAHAFNRAGYPVVACASRTLSHAQELARGIPDCRAFASPSEAAALADWVFVTVPDDAIARVASEIEWQAHQLAVHCSGALPATTMAAAATAGAGAAGFHPLQTFADPEVGLANLPGSSIGVEADETTWPKLAALTIAVGARPLRIGPENRATYHLGSVIVSNFTVGLMGLATDLWETIGIDRDTGLTSLLPLLSGTTRNMAALGVPAALTGPAARGDAGTLMRHLDALRGNDDAQRVYQSVTRLLIELARQQGRLSPQQIAALDIALGDDASTGRFRPPSPVIEGS